MEEQLAIGGWQLEINKCLETGSGQALQSYAGTPNFFLHDITLEPSETEFPSPKFHFLTNRHAFWPPKPKELLSAYVISIGLALFGT